MYKKKYQLVGMINPFGMIPGLIKPVFKDEEDNIYFSYNYDKNTEEYSPYIIGFSRISNNFISCVKELSDCVIMLETDKEYYSVGDLNLCGIEIKNNVAFIGTIDKYLDYLKYYKQEIMFNQELKDMFLDALSDEIKFNEPIVNKYLQESENKEGKQLKKRIDNNRDK